MTKAAPDPFGEFVDDLARVIAPAVRHRVLPGHDASALIRAMAGKAAQSGAASGAVRDLPRLPEVDPLGPGEAIARSRDLTIIDGREVGVWFEPGMKNTTRRKVAPRVIGIHWTGGSLRRTAQGVGETLRARGYSIGYVCEGDGDVVQCADDMTECAHIGDGDRANGDENERALGIECANPGFDRKADRRPFLGARYRFADWPPEQLEALRRLVEHLCAKWDIPRVLAPEARDLPRDFEGVVGHFNWHESKLDPGPIPFAYLEAHGFARVT